MNGPLLTSLTIYASLISYLFAVLCWVSHFRGTNYRRLWTLGCLSLWAHAACAFHFYHGWSHASVVAQTAAETEAIFGEPFGEGIYFSYLLMWIWLLDVAALWFVPAYRQNMWGRVIGWMLHAYAMFILFSGTVVFEQGPVRWAGIIGTLWIVQMAWRYARWPRILAASS